ncbi:hypothetical protein, partial [Arcobacter sp.]|uniref:hypothetical protein n=1 Tax=Arcobacter sp. TaxID=1872629 RepID=UPI003D0B8CA4
TSPMPRAGRGDHRAVSQLLLQHDCASMGRGGQGERILGHLFPFLFIFSLSFLYTLISMENCKNPLASKVFFIYYL